ncbi:LamG-like jellyroll fold domain-containing protein [uncultured Fibrella sp.]|uniref:LamG domain-containing protein n=1 Tax=uncultured Fibrella sp. TaxID=1284596 RepID=UPI0035CC4173
MRHLRRIYVLALAVAGSSLLLNCQTWDLPTRKAQRVCITPGGQLGSSANQLQATLTIGQPTGTTDRVDWDFGDAKTQSTSELSVAHTYAAKGTYTVKATMSNLCSFSTVLTTSVKVTDAVPPTVIVLDPIDITKSTATLRMMVTDNGKALLTEYGLCYSKTSTSPVVTDPNTKTAATPGNAAVNQTQSFVVSGLEPYVTYYVRAYARNEANLTGTPSYSTEVRSFQLLSDPIVNLIDGASISGTTGSVSFSVVNQGNPAASQYGIVYSATTNTPTVDNSSAVTVPSPVFTSSIPATLSGLSIDRTYYYRAFARSATGSTVYSATTGTFSTVDITSDLIINVPFTNQSYTDLSGNNNTANPIGTPGFVTDHKGAANSAILLNGNGQYFYFIDGAALRPAALSISFWIKANALTGRMQLYNKSRFSDNLGEQYSSLIKPADSGSGITINTDIKQGSNCNYSVGWQTFPVTSNIPVINTWRHIVFTYEGRTARMYLDGTLLSERTDLPASNMDNCAGGDLKFGAQIKDFPQYFNGAMDDVRVYKRALTSAQAKALSDL